MKSLKNVPPAALSVVLAVREAEETVGRDVRRIAEHLRAQGMRFEILGVNDGCRDNSLAVLRLCEGDVPELRLLAADVAGRAFIRGTAEARGDVVALADLGRGSFPLAALGWALARIEAGCDAVVFRSRCIVAERLACIPAIVRSIGRGDLFEWSFARSARDLTVEFVGRRARRPGLIEPMLRLFAA